MQGRIFLGARALGGAALLAFFLFPHEEASAQTQRKAQQKCVNELNKNFSKVASAQGGDINSCIKNAGKGKLGAQTIEECITSDPKGKVAKATGKALEKGGPDGKCPESDSPDFGATDPNTANMVAVDKELALIHWIFGSDLDSGVILSDGSDGAKCQAAMVKDVFKCQDTKLKAYNACKKNKLSDKVPPQVTSAQELQDACLGIGTAGIPDGKGKIAGKCETKLSSDAGKKCGGSLDPNALFPGCAGQDLADCLDQKVECVACLALNAIDWLNRDCDLFDDESPNGSCPTTFLGFTGKPIGYHSKPFDVRTFCKGGTEDGEPCEDDGDCPPGRPDARCATLASIEITTQDIDHLTFPLAGRTATDCGVVDPNTGVATCQCVLIDVEPVDIGPIGFVCFDPFPDCPTGLIDCDGGTPMDIEMISDHHIGLTLQWQDPNLLDLGLYCGMLDPNTGNQQCEAACESYCAGLPGSYSLFVSACEGFCEGGPREDLTCTYDRALDPEESCPQSSCAGTDPVTHRNHCQCQCAQVGGNPSDPGGMYCQTGTSVVVESEEPCNGLDITSVVGKRCALVSTESAHSSIRNADNEDGHIIDGGVLRGIRPNCSQMAAGQAVISTVGHRIFQDSTMGDQESATTSMTGTQ
jgi:hypothetical protein